MKQLRTSKKVVPFLQTAGYYNKKGSQYFQQNKLDKALLFFKKSIELEPDNALHHYNLACLLSRMNYPEKANEIFNFIVQQLDPTFTECFFLLAINHGLVGELEKARYYLNLYLQYEPDGEMAFDAEELLLVLSEQEEKYNLSPTNISTGQYITRVYSKDEAEMIESYKQSQVVRDNIWRALYHKNEEIAEKAIHLYGLLGEGSGEKVLREFVRNPWVNQRLRLQALLKLKNLGIRGLVDVYMDGDLRYADLSYFPLLAPCWTDTWQEVLETTLKNMRKSGRYDEHFYEDVQAIWIDYLNNIYPVFPQVKKIETWAAGLEYAVARFHFLSLTQKILSEQYGVSTASISARFREMNRVLHLEKRAYRNMLIYLVSQEKD